MCLLSKTEKVLSLSDLSIAQSWQWLFLPQWGFMVNSPVKLKHDYFHFIWKTVDMFSAERSWRETDVTMEGFLCESAGAKLRASRAWHDDWPKLSSDQIIGSFPFDAFSWDYFQRLLHFHSACIFFYQPWVPHCYWQKPSCCKKRRYHQSRAWLDLTLIFFGSDHWFISNHPSL